MTRQEFLSKLERALGKLPHAEVEQALAFYDEAISDHMEDGLSEAEAVADLGSIEEIAAQIAAETPPIPREHRQPHPQHRAARRVLPHLGARRARARGGRARRVRRDLGGHRRVVGRRRGPRAHALRGNRRTHLDPGRGYAAARRLRPRPLARVERLRTRRLLRRVLGEQAALLGDAHLRALDREPVRARERRT